MQTTADNQKLPADLSKEEEKLLSSAEQYLAEGIDLKRWYNQTLAEDAWADKFQESQVYNRPASSFGFFDHAPVGGETIPVMGNFQYMFYDKLKARPGQEQAQVAWMQEQMRAFIMTYFMRISDFREPEAVPDPNAPQPPIWLRPLSWRPKDDPTRIGFGFSQLFYKRMSDGAICRFPEASKNAIVDLREIGSTYEWIMVYVNIFDFSFALKPFTGDTPSLDFPLTTGSYLIINKDFVTFNEQPQGALAEYGFGYAFVRNPSSSILNYGPGEFTVAFEQIDFQILDDGRVRVNMSFASNRPNRVLNVPLDPPTLAKDAAELLPFGLGKPFEIPLQMMSNVSPTRNLVFDPLFAGIDLANISSLGYVGHELGWTQDTLFRIFLLKHFQQHYQTIAGSLQTWRQIPNWLDEQALPDWVIKGESS